MSIFEIVPEHKVGPFEWGEKLGKELNPGSGATVDSNEHGFPDHLSWSGMGVVIDNPDSVKPILASGTSFYGYVQTEQPELHREEINQHPVVGKKLRWVLGSTS